MQQQQQGPFANNHFCDQFLLIADCRKEEQFVKINLLITIEDKI